MKQKTLRLKQKIKIFWYLHWKQKLVFILAFFLMGILRLLVLIIPFRYFSKIMGTKMADTPFKVSFTVFKKASIISSIVQKVSRYTPWESKCLVQAVTAQIILRLLGIPSTIYFGISKESCDKLLAHAWLRCGDLIVTGKAEKQGFKAVMHFASLSKK